MTRWGVAAHGTTAFLLTATLALLAGAQLAPGWAPGRTLAPLEPAPLPDVPPCAAAASAPVALDGVEVPTWLTAPEGRAPEVAVVLIPGAGSADRDTLLPFARALAACGIAAVTYDKGSGSIVRRDFEASAAAASEVVTAVRRATGAGRVGVVAWSEGGWVSAHLLPRVDFAVSIGAPVVTPVEQLAWAADRVLTRTPHLLRRLPAVVLGQPSGLRWTSADVRPLLAATDVPLLGVWGTHDPVGPVVEAAGRLRDAAPHASVLLLAGGHDLSDGAWAPQVAAWVRDPIPRLLEGSAVAPAGRHGIPALPRTTWYTHPLTHLAVGIAVAVLVGVRSARTHRSTS